MVRINLAELKLIIIDEMSMVSSDMLYNIHQRLCELFQLKTVFANKGILLVGDLLQLRPIQGKYIFEQPRNSDYVALYNSSDSIWNSFDVVNLVHNHRQGAGSKWADVLNRIRDASFTKDDIELLRSRLIPDPYIPELASASHIYYTNMETTSYNDSMLKSLGSTKRRSIAVCTGPPGYEPTITSYGTIDDTGLKKELLIKEGARIMLIVNLNQKDYLVNGSFGTILKIVMKNSEVDHLIIQFDHPMTGIKQREDHPTQSHGYESQNGTPIFKQHIDYNICGSRGRKHQAKASILQFPIKLAWAITAHKMQVCPLMYFLLIKISTCILGKRLINVFI